MLNYIAILSIVAVGACAAFAAILATVKITTYIGGLIIHVWDAWSIPILTFVACSLSIVSLIGVHDIRKFYDSLRD